MNGGEEIDPTEPSADGQEAAIVTDDGTTNGIAGETTAPSTAEMSKGERKTAMSLDPTEGIR